MDMTDVTEPTAVRLTPPGWRAARIKDLATIGTGSRNTQDRKPDGAFPLFVRSQVIERIDTYSFDGEAVLTAGDGVGTGKVFHYVRGPHEVHQRVYRIADFDPTLLGLFFYHYFSKHFFDRIMSMTAKSSVDSVRMEMIADMVIPVPPVEEQRLIAEALTDVDDLLIKLRGLLDKTKNRNLAVAQQLFEGKIRLSGFGGPWRRVSLGSILSVRHGKNQHGIVSADGRYPILATGGEIGRTNHWLSNRPSVLIGRKGTIDAPQYVDTPFWTIDTLFYTDIASTTDPRFLYFLFKRIPWRRYNEASGVPSLNAATIEAIEVSIPSLTEQQEIGIALRDMDAEEIALERRLSKTRDLKQAMAQQLLTGRIRLA